MDPRPLNRVQLSKIAGGDPDAVRALERLFQVAGQLTPDVIAALQAVVNGQVAELSALRSEFDFAVDHGVPYLGLLNLPDGSDAHDLSWNENDGTANLALNNDVVLQIGQEAHFYAKNASGGTVTNGTVVQFSGTVGASAKLEFDLALGDGTVPAEYLMGIATEDIANNGFGYITNFGVVRGLNTSGSAKTVPETWADGDLLYLDKVYPGELTKTEPDAPAIRQPIAVVLHAASGGSGSLFVRMTYRDGLNGLNDVFGTPSDGDLLQWSAANGRWEMISGASGTFTAGSGETVTVTNGVITSIV